MRRYYRILRIWYFGKMKLAKRMRFWNWVKEFEKTGQMIKAKEWWYFDYKTGETKSSPNPGEANITITPKNINHE